MDNPEVTYDTPEQRLAIHGHDTEIYPYLPCYSHATLIRDDEDRVHRQDASSFIYMYPYALPSKETYDERPETIPFSRDDLEAFIEIGIKSVEGYWSVCWASETRAAGDIIYYDNYRSVMSFRSIEFMIRPTADFRNREDEVEEPARLYIGWRDVEECLRQALGRSGPMRTFTGVAHINQPRRGEEDVIEGKREIAVEWRIDRAHPDTMKFVLEKWRHEAFKKPGSKGSKAYHDKMKEVRDHAAKEEYFQKFQARNPAATRPEDLFNAYVPRSQPEPEQDPIPARRERKPRRRGKRTSTDMSASQELSPTKRRRNVGSQSSRTLQSGSAPQSLTSSPETGRQTPVVGASQHTSMPPPPNPPYAQWSVGSQSSGSSRSGSVSQSTTSSPETGRQAPTGAWPRTMMPPPPNPQYIQRSVSSQSSRSSQSGQSFTYSPETGRQTPGGTWQRTMMPPQPNPQYAQQTYPNSGYQPSPPAASPRMGQPYAPMPMQHAPSPGSEFAHGQRGGAATPYWQQAPPAPGSYSPGTGSYSPVAPGAAPPMSPYQGMTPGAWGRGGYSPSPSFPSLAMAPPGGNVVRYQDNPSWPSGGANYATGPSFHSPAMAAPGGNVYRPDPPPSPQVPPNYDPDWWGQARDDMHSNQPHGGNQSGYQGQYGGGSGSGQR